MMVFTLLVAIAGAVATLAGRSLPRRIGAYDLLLITAGIHKLLPHPEQDRSHRATSSRCRCPVEPGHPDRSDDR